MSIPTHGETYAKLFEHLRLAQEDCALLAHLTRAEGGKKSHAVADGWISISELMKRIEYQVTQLAQRKMQ